MRATDLQKIRRLVITQIVTGIVAIAAFTIAITNLNETTATIQTSRQDARRDNCYLLRRLVQTAAPPGRQKAVHTYLASSQLANCDAYARSLK